MNAVPVDPAVSSTPLRKDAENLASVCVLCSHNCGIRIDVKDGRIAAVRADESNPITKGYICNKGFSVVHYVEHDQRVQHPLRRRADGSFEPISWDIAISEIGTKLRRIRDEHSGRSIGLVGLGGQANHMDAPFGLSFLMGLESKRWFNAFAQEKTQHFLMDQWMFDSSPATWFHPDVERAEVLLMMGTNPRISNRGHNPNDTFKAIERNAAQRVIVVDPRETESTRQADRHMRVKPGTDAYMLLAIAATLVSSEGMVDSSFVSQHTQGFDELREALSKVDIDQMSQRCGLSSEELLETARELAAADSAAIMYDLAVEQTPFSTLISYLIRVISTLTGNLAQAGGNFFVETTPPPLRNPGRFAEPERALASGIQSISSIGDFPMFSPTLVPEEIQFDHPQRLRALVVEGSNPLLSYSDAQKWREAREELDLLVVIDPAMTETAQLADYVLPTPVGYEKWEIALFPKGSPEVFVQLRPPVVPGPEDALPEPEIYARLAEAAQLFEAPPAELFELAKGALEPAGAAAYFGKLQEASGGNATKVMFWAYRTLGPKLPAPSLVSIWAQCLTNALARRESVLRTLGEAWTDKGPFEIGLELFQRVLDHPEGVEIARSAPVEQNLKDNIGYEDGRVRLSPERMLEEIDRAVNTAPRSDPNFPMVLGSGLRTRWTANTIQRKPEWRKGRGPHCTLHISSGDADRLGIADGETVRLVTHRASAELPAEVDGKLSDGYVWVPNGFGVSYPGPDGVLVQQGINLNELSDASDRDPISGCPHHKATPCRVERA